MNMKKNLILLLLCGCPALLVAQSKIKQRQNELTLSASGIFWQNQEIRSLIGPPTMFDGTPYSGNAFSSGLNLTCSHTLFNGFFVSGGVGYFRQNFKIHRPFDYYDPETNLFYTTKSYSYNCLNLMGGIGYKYSLNTDWSLKAVMTYNHLITFRQKYNPKTGNPAEIHKDSYHFGHLIVAGLGIQRKICERLFLEAGVLLPLSTKWREDAIFREDNTKYFSPKASLGASIAIGYAF